MKVTNTSEAPQGVHTLGGVVYIQPGEFKNLDLNAELVELASQLDFLILEGKPTKGEAKKADIPTIDVPDNEVDQLRQQLETQTSEAARLNGVVSEKDAEILRLNGTIADRDTEIANLKQAAMDDSSGDDANTDDVRTALKAQANALGIEFARNITTDKLKDLVDAKVAENAAAAANQSNGDGSKPDDVADASGTQDGQQQSSSAQ